ncbi:MAG: neutral zinc metallopeptidase [Halioglobus sp.]|nr:neutral zinc metallopeptidase [Halioglobus sp.]
MRWRGGRRSENIDDRRGQGPAAGGAGLAPAAMRFLPLLLKTKAGRVLLVGGIVLIFGGKLIGVDVLSLLAGAGGSVATAPVQMSEADNETAEFVSVVLADTEATWHQIFGELGRRYPEPTLVLFAGRVNSACGSASSAVGPFYCPGDQQLYIDLSFFRDLARRHGAPGDFAQAYVVAHEVGHHVQTVLGISEKVHAAKRDRSQAEANALSVRQELQADCFAGLWGNAANIDRKLLEPGDLEEALQAATAIGDDRLQREAGRQAVPDSFTHGTSEQRVRWFRRGFESGDFNSCDTFAARSL